MAVNNKYSRSLKSAAIFFIVALLLQTFYDYAKSGVWALHWGDFTFMVPLLVFAWQVISEFMTERQLEVLNNVNKTIEQLPKNVQESTKQEIDRLQEDNQKFRSELAKGVVEHERHYYRTLTYLRDQGSLFNGFGEEKKSRNVLFSNKTINLIFREIRDIDRNKQKQLHDIGKRASERFAAEMVAGIQQQAMSNINLIDWIKKWIEFDSDAGFGKFELEGKEDNWVQHKVILLKYSFLTQDCAEDPEKSIGLCDFMTGYLEGILSSFPEDVLEPFDLTRGNVIVTHDVNSDKECVCAGRRVTLGCRYHLTSRK